MKFKLSEFIESSRTKPKNSASVTNPTDVRRIQQIITVDFNMRVDIHSVSRWLETLNSLDIFMLEFESDVDDRIKTFTMKIEYPLTVTYGHLYKTLSDCVDERYEMKVVETNSVQYDSIDCTSDPVNISRVQHPLLNRTINIIEYGTHDKFYLMGITVTRRDWAITSSNSSVFVKSINITSSTPEIATEKEAKAFIKFDTLTPVVQSVFNLPDNKKIEIHEYDKKSKSFMTTMSGVLYKISLDESPFVAKLLDTHLGVSSENEWFVKQNKQVGKNEHVYVVNTSFEIDRATRIKMDKYALKLKASK